MSCHGLIYNQHGRSLMTVSNQSGSLHPTPDQITFGWVLDTDCHFDRVKRYQQNKMLNNTLKIYENIQKASKINEELPNTGQ